MDYLLDTDTCIFCLRHRPLEVKRRLEEAGFHRVSVSAITSFELRTGAEKHAHPIKARENLRAFLAPFRILPLTDAVAEQAAKIRANLERRGAMIGPYDILIAAHAKTLGLTAVTSNEHEFRRVDGLKVENWCPLQ
jgi:tRNA(fMet)-specific endonuclease VapC